jgi:hypothetical protein
MKQRFVKIALIESVLGFINLFANQCALFLFLQGLDFFQNFRIARVVGEALQVSQIPRQRPAFFDRHVAVHERIDLADRGFRRGADVIARCHSDEIHRTYEAVHHTAPEIGRAPTHQLFRLIEVVMIDNRL